MERAVEGDEKGGKKNVSRRIIKSERSRAWGRIGNRGAARLGGRGEQRGDGREKREGGVLFWILIAGR